MTYIEIVAGKLTHLVLQLSNFSFQFELINLLALLILFHLIKLTLGLNLNWLRLIFGIINFQFFHSHIRLSAFTLTYVYAGIFEIVWNKKIFEAGTLWCHKPFGELFLKGIFGSSALNPGAVFLFFTVAFLLFLNPVGGSNPVGPTFKPCGAIINIFLT